MSRQKPIKDMSAVVWYAVEKIACENKLTLSGLAKKCGLDATAFNRCKRTANGKPHWPSTMTLYKIISTFGMTPVQFAEYIERFRARA